jgi:hypothetical protein
MLHQGATHNEIVAATNWLSHTSRTALLFGLRKRNMRSSGNHCRRRQKFRDRDAGLPNRCGTRMSESGCKNCDRVPTQTAFWVESATAKGVHAEIEARERFDLRALRESTAVSMSRLAPASLPRGMLYRGMAYRSDGLFYSSSTHL